MRTPPRPSRRGRSCEMACLLVFLCAAMAQSQSRPNVIERVLVEGTTRFSAAEISLASGLKPGQPADEAALSAAADRLASSGAFSEVSYQYKTLNGKMTVTFQITDQAKTMECTFDNFVWFTSDELDHAVRSELPLYDGRLPLEGDLSHAVTGILEHLLAAHHINATVSYLPAAKFLGAPPTEFRYSAAGNLPPIASVEFTGGPLPLNLFDMPKQRLMGRPYSFAYSHSLVQNELDVIYQNHAYLRAHFSDAQVTFVPGASGADPGTVKLLFIVTPGVLYTWSAADWNGNSAYSSADLERYFGMKTGEPAAADKISAGTDAVREAYGKKGYIALKLTPQQNFDDATHQVHYSFQVNEGAQYHMGAFVVAGYDDSTAEQVRKMWKLNAGDVYNASYLREFINKTVPAPRTSESGKTHLNTSIRPNPSTLAVDVTLSVASE